MLPDQMKTVVSPYVSPIFEQQWSMFAPCPLVEGKIKMNIQHKDGETGWIHPANQANDWHRILRFTHHGEIALLEANLIYWVNYDRVDFALKYDEDFDEEIFSIFSKEASSYHFLKRYVVGVSGNLGIEAISAEVICELENVKTGEGGELRYPSYKFKND